MYEEMFAARIAQLRINKGVSARDMSLSIGQNPGYINNIESGKSLPSMSAFFFICDYLDITPQEFFDTEAKNPSALKSINDNLIKMSQKQLDIISAIIEEFIN